MGILKDNSERPLLILSCISVALLIISGARFPLNAKLNETTLGLILTSPAYIAIFENLLIGFLTAYMFYLLNSYFPKQKQKNDNLKLLNSCIASILDSYKRTRIWGHETALPYVNTECLNTDWLKQQIAELKKSQTNVLKLKFALDTAYTRESDFKNLLQIASSISPQHAEKWLVLIDKVRLLSENYGQQPELPEEQMHLALTRDIKSPLYVFHKDLEFRIMELMELTIEWLDLK